MNPEQGPSPFRDTFETVDLWKAALEQQKGITIKEKERYSNSEGEEVIVFLGSNGEYYLLSSTEKRNLFMTSHKKYSEIEREVTGYTKK